MPKMPETEKKEESAESREEAKEQVRHHGIMVLAHFSFANILCSWHEA